MKTQCTPGKLTFQPFSSRKVEADFTGGRISSDGGLPLLQAMDRRLDLTARAAECFTDRRIKDLVEHSVVDMVRQRVYGLAAGYEDLNDHQTLRDEPLLAAMVGKTDPLGASRARERDKGHPLASPPTLNRFEFAATNPFERYKKVQVDLDALADLLATIWLESVSEEPESIVLDLDATDIPLYGHQEKRFFHGYYDNYCYLPLLLFCGDQLIAARLLPADRDPAKHATDVLAPVISRIRRKFPNVPVIVRGDSGFCREPLMYWCELRKVHFLLGLAKNDVLKRVIATELAEAEEELSNTGEPARRFKDFTYRTKDTWSRSRRVVGKAEALPKGENPRFVVTTLHADDFAARELYENEYCGRGQMENEIKQYQLDLFADRLSAHDFAMNQLRMLFAGLAYVLMSNLRSFALAGTELEKTYLGTIRLKILKIGALITVSARRIHIRLSSGYPLQGIFATAWRRLHPQPG